MSVIRRLNLIVMLAACLWACGDDSSTSAGMKADSVPAELKAGTTIAWNPTIKIVDGTRFTYENTADSAFTASIQNGTYTYAEVGGVGTLTIDGESADDGKSLSNLPTTLKLTKASTGLEVEIGADKFSAVITLPAAPAGGGTSVTGTLPDGATAATVSADLVGSYDLVFGYGQAGAPFQEGDMETFVIGADNTLTAFGKKIGDPYTKNGNAAEIIWNDGEHAWAVSNNDSGVFNEINVGDASTNEWLGQWADASKFETPVVEGDIGNDVTFEVNGLLENPNFSAPYAQGEMVTVNWDGSEGLTVTFDGDSVMPAYVGEMEFEGPGVYGEEDVVRVLTWEVVESEGGQEYLLKLSAEDRIEVFEAKTFQIVNADRRLYSTAIARR